MVKPFVKPTRKALRYSQRKLADLVNVTTSAISQWEREETTPKGEHLVRLAEVLNCTVQWLVGTEDSSNITSTVGNDFTI